MVVGKAGQAPQLLGILQWLLLFEDKLPHSAMRLDIEAAVPCDLISRSVTGAMHIAATCHSI